MTKVGIIYASMTGNTEEIAEVLSQELQDKFTVELKDMESVEPEDLEQYDGILIGSYTDGDGDLPFEAEIFFDDLDNVDLSGKLVGCFGSGDTLYDDYCASAHNFHEKVKQTGADVIEHVLEIELSPSDDDQMDSCLEFANTFSEKLLQRAEGKLNV